MMIKQKIFEFNNVFKSYSGKKVFEDFSLKLDIATKEVNETNQSNHSSNIIALLGANGAGKTTLLKMLLGLERPQRGKVRVFGHDPQNAKTRVNIGATPQELGFADGVKVSEVLQFVQKHYKTPLPTEKLIETFKLADFFEHKAQSLSGGQRRRLALALAFVGNSPLVLLDEPTTGLDVIARKSFWNYIQQESSKTILLTTHDLSEIEKVANRLLFLQGGEIVFDGTVSEFKKSNALSIKKIYFYCENVVLESIRSIEYVKSVVMQDNNFVIESYQSDDCIRELVKNDIHFENLHVESSTLEESFLNLSQE